MLNECNGVGLEQSGSKISQYEQHRWGRQSEWSIKYITDIIRSADCRVDIVVMSLQ